MAGNSNARLRAPVLVFLGASGECIELQIEDGDSIAKIRHRLAPEYRNALKLPFPVESDMLSVIFEPGDIEREAVEVGEEVRVKLSVPGAEPEFGPCREFERSPLLFDPDVDVLRVCQSRSLTTGELGSIFATVITSNASGAAFAVEDGSGTSMSDGEGLVMFLLRELLARGDDASRQPAMFSSAANETDFARLAALLVVLKCYSVAAEVKNFNNPWFKFLQRLELGELLPSRKTWFPNNFYLDGAEQFRKAAKALGIMELTKRSIFCNLNNDFRGRDNVVALVLMKLVSVAEAIRGSMRSLSISVPAHVLDFPRNLVYKWLEAESVRGGMREAVSHAVLVLGPEIGEKVPVLSFMGDLVGSLASSRKLQLLGSGDLNGLPRNVMSSMAKQVVRIWEDDLKYKQKIWTWRIWRRSRWIWSRSAVTAEYILGVLQQVQKKVHFFEFFCLCRIFHHIFLTVSHVFIYSGLQSHGEKRLQAVSQDADFDQ